MDLLAFLALTGSATAASLCDDCAGFAVTPALGWRKPKVPDAALFVPRSYPVGTLAVAWQPSPVFGIELVGTHFERSLTRRYDWQPITKQIIDPRRVTISEPTDALSTGFVFVPLRGEVQFQRRHAAEVSVWTSLGTGAIWTVDDLDVLQKVGVQDAERTRDQVHPTLALGLGTRLKASERVEIEAGWRRHHYIEVIESVDLHRSRASVVALGARIKLGS